MFSIYLTERNCLPIGEYNAQHWHQLPISTNTYNALAGI